MNCYLSWNLKDMTNISAEKLQKNISQQTSYIQLYRSELTKEAYKFNIGSLLRHVCTERASFGTDPIQKRATDCLIIFLHTAAFQKVTYFAPTDAENPAVAKCARNLHRLMLENVKSTMRFIDYEVLQKHARGEIDASELFSERERIHNSVFPDDSLLPVSDSDSLNAEFLKLAEMETRKARTFVDFDVQRNTSIETDLCQKLAKVPRCETALPDSRYGLIGSCSSSLETPFIRYGNSYYSFVTAYSLRAIADTVAQYEQEHPAAAPEPVQEEPETEEAEAEETVVEPPVVEEPMPVEPEEVEDPVEEESEPEESAESEEQDEPEIIEEPEQEEASEPEEIEEEPVEDEPEIPEEPQLEEEPEEREEPEEQEPETEESVEDEPEELEESAEPEEEPEEIPEPEKLEESSEPEEIEEEPAEEDEDIPFEEPVETYDEPEMTEASDEEEDDEEELEVEEPPVEEPVIEQMPSDDDDEEEEEQPEDPFEDDEDDPSEEEENYTALVSPDAYDYLNDSKAESFERDPMLEEQEYDDWYDDDEDEQLPPEEDDEPDPYSGESLFSIMDDSDEGEIVEEPAPQDASEDNLIQKDSFPTYEDEEEDLPPELPLPSKPQEEDSEDEEPEAEQESPEELPVEEEPAPEPSELEEEPEAEPEIQEEPPAEEKPAEEPAEEPALQEPEVEKPVEQPLPLLEQILSFAPSKNNPIVQYLNGCQYEQKKEIVRFIEMARKAWLIDGKDKVFSIPDTSISVAVFSQTQDPMLSLQRRENIGAVMFASQKDSWNSLEISYDGSGQLVKADYVRISRSSYTEWEWKIVEKLGNRLLERRGK